MGDRKPLRVTACAAAAIAAVAACGREATRSADAPPEHAGAAAPVDAPASANATTPTSPPATTSTPAGPADGVRFRVRALPEGADGVPRNRIAVVLRRGDGAEEALTLGVFSGSCVNGADHLERGQIVRIDCWWAGAGDTFFVERQADALVVMRKEVDSEAPDFKPKPVAKLPFSRARRVEAADPEWPAR